MTLEKGTSRDKACERCAQSLLEVITDQNAEGMRGEEIHSVIFKMTNKQKEGGETDYL